MNWDYVAGLFDGEGSIQLKKYPDSSKGRGIVLVIGITDRNVLDKLQEFLATQGIKSYVYHRTTLRANETKPCQWWQISNKWDAVKFLHAIRDKSIVKQKRIDEALEFRQKLTAFTRPFTHDELEKIKKLHFEGSTGAEIASEMGCGRSKITKAFNLLGIKNSRIAWRKRFKGRKQKYPRRTSDRQRGHSSVQEGLKGDRPSSLRMVSTAY